MVEVEWRRLRADELREQARRNAIVMLPLGSIEQHGPHLPVDVDSALVEAVARGVASELASLGSPALTLPVLWPGVSEHHMSFGGAITLDLATYAAVIGAILRSVVRHGFTRLVLLNGHGGNDNALRSITDDLTPKLGVPIIQFCYWYAAAAPIRAILETQDGLHHACEAETSMLMVVRPGAVATERIALAARRAEDSDEPMPAGFYRWRAIVSRSRSGVIGNPAAAGVEKGERLFAAIAKHIAGVLHEPSLWNTPWQDIQPT
jgi:creatinine amidohydrolase